MNERINHWFLSGMIFFWASYFYFMMEYVFDANNFWPYQTLIVLGLAIIFTKLTIDFRRKK